MASLSNDKRTRENSGGDKLSILHPNMSRFVDGLRRIQGNFQGPVVGPIASHIKIRESVEDTDLKPYGRAIEWAFNNHFSSFVVTSVEDQRTLASYMKKERLNFAVICLKDTTRFRDVARIGALTVSDAVVIENDLVFNALTNVVHMESIGTFNSFCACLLYV